MKKLFAFVWGSRRFGAQGARLVIAFYMYKVATDAAQVLMN